MSGGDNSYDIGGLVGSNQGGTVSSSYATGAVFSIASVGNIFGTGGDIGGLVGFNTGVISSSYSTGSVGSDGAVASVSIGVGGLVGENTGVISSSYSTGSVSSDGAVASVSLGVGGLVGQNAGTISSSYATGGVSNGISALPLIGGGAGTVDASSRMLSYAASFSAGSYVGWSFATTPTNGTWTMVNGYTRPFLASEYGTTITNAHQLQLIYLDPSASYTLANSIGMADLASASGLWNTGTGFVPIGFNTSGQNLAPTPFSGTFDGHGFTISGMTIASPSSNNLGLFSDIGAGGVVKEPRSGRRARHRRQWRQ